MIPTIRTYLNGLRSDSQRIVCFSCDPERTVIRKINLRWVFPCDITFHCSVCDCEKTIHYTDSCLLAKQVKKLKDGSI